MSNLYPCINAHLNSFLLQTYSAADQTFIQEIMVQMSSA